MNQAIVVDLGRIDYEKCWDLQHRIHEGRRRKSLPNCLLLLEHPHVLTLGRKGNRNNVLLEEGALKQQGICVLPVERGGDVTYHGPGQLVGYPIFDLGLAGGGVIEFIEGLEEVMIRTLRDFGIAGGRNPVNRGVWVDRAKIGFVGIAVRHGITMHGFALNGAPDLRCFDMINPCGLKAVEITSMDRLLGYAPSMEALKGRVAPHMADVFDLSIESMAEETLLSELAETGSQ